MRLQLHDDISCREIVRSRTLSFQNIRCRPPTSTFLYLLPSPTGNPPWLSCSSTVGCEKIELIPVAEFHEGAYNQVQESQGHEAHLTHDLIGGAVGYEAIKKFNEYQAKNGKPVEHAQAKELIGGFVSAALTNLVETKGLDQVDKFRAEQEAKRHAEEALRPHYE
ncbi:hypothetical protein AFCA_011185 [Aspergillus flavus]|nr:hypothetical protein AFCA_011185 [Aspergillus flavus]